MLELLAKQEYSQFSKYYMFDVHARRCAIFMPIIGLHASRCIFLMALSIRVRASLGGTRQARIRRSLCDHQISESNVMLVGNDSVLDAQGTVVEGEMQLPQHAS